MHLFQFYIERHINHLNIKPAYQAYHPASLGFVQSFQLQCQLSQVLCWKCNFPSCVEIMTDGPTVQPTNGPYKQTTNQRTDGHEGSYRSYTSKDKILCLTRCGTKNWQQLLKDGLISVYGTMTNSGNCRITFQDKGTF